MNYIVAIDIGGTTFNSGIFSEKLKKIAISSKDKIRYYGNKDEVINAIINQVSNLISKNNISKKDIIGIGIASPGPLDSLKGIILNTPNLKIFQNYAITSDFTKKLGINTFVGNDANLFAMGERYSFYKKTKVFIGITLGTGLGFGLIINGELFTGANGMAMEYALSPFQWGICEKNVSRAYIIKRAKDLYGEELSPRVIETYYKRNDKKAVKIYNEYGNNLGIVLSHIINMIDPEVISIGGGLSKAFNCFETKMYSALKKHSPSFNINHIIVTQSKLREKSTMIGASLMVKYQNK